MKFRTGKKLVEINKNILLIDGSVLSSNRELDVHFCKPGAVNELTLEHVGNGIDPVVDSCCVILKKNGSGPALFISSEITEVF